MGPLLFKKRNACTSCGGPICTYIYRDHECVQCGRSPAKGEEMQQIKAIITFRLKD